MTTTVYSSDAGVFQSGTTNAIASFQNDGLNPAYLTEYVPASPNSNVLFGVVQFLVDLPRAATINSAKLRLYIYTSATGTAAPTFKGINENNATWTTNPTTQAGRAFTTAQSGDPASITGSTVAEWDVTAILQEIVNRAGFTGPYVMFQVVSVDTASAHKAEYLTDPGDATLAKRPTLVIDASGTANGAADNDCYWNVGSASAVIQGPDFLHVSGNGPSRYSAMVRFPGGIPKGASIISANLGFHQKVGTTGGYPSTVRVFDILGDVSTFPTNCLDADTLASNAGTFFDMVVDGPGHTFFDPFTVDVKAQIEELVAQSTWNSFKQIAFFFYQTTIGGDFIPMSIEGGTPIALTVVWGADGGGGSGAGPGGQTGVNASALWMLFDSRE